MSLSRKTIMIPVAVGYSLQDLQNYLKETGLTTKLSFVLDAKDDDLENICKQFMEYLDEEITIEQMAHTFVVSCMLYFIASKYQSLCFNQLSKTFSIIDTISPVHIHYFTKLLWNGLNPDGPAFALNIIKISHNIAAFSLTGRCIAMCLNWKIICEITETDCPMFRFRKLSELNQMLNLIDNDMLKLDDSLKNIYILAHAIGFLIANAVSNENAALKKFGYEDYFQHPIAELKKLQKWCDQFSETIMNSCTKMTDAHNLRSLIQQEVYLNATSALQAKLSEANF